MKAYSAERKEALVRRMMPPENALVSALAREMGITEQTLYTWRRQAKGQGLAVPGDGKNPEAWSSEDKFAVVLETCPPKTMLRDSSHRPARPTLVLSPVGDTCTTSVR